MCSTPRGSAARKGGLVRTRPRYLAWVVACIVGGVWTAAAAQTYYKWTDDRGVVHFSDQAPMQTKGVEERQLPPGPPPAEEAASPPEPLSPGTTAGRGEAPPAQGPAQVIVVSQQSPRTGASSIHVAGKVKNVGGGDARHVAVTISAVDSQQGNPCLQEEVPVTPPTLRSGETAGFDTDVDSPCLFGDPKVHIDPVWE